MDASVGDPPVPILIKVDAGSKQAENSLSSRSPGVRRHGGVIGGKQPYVQSE